MAEDIRRSGRATKGQHKGLDDEPAPAPGPKGKPAKEPKQGKGAKGKKGKAVEPEPEEEEDEEEGEEVIRCICGITEESNQKRAYVACDMCGVWQHNDCMQLDPKIDWEKEDYFCEQCKPYKHKELLAAMSRGEKPWLKQKGKRKSLKAGTKAQASEAPSVKSEEAGTPKPTPSLAEQASAPEVKSSPAPATNGASRASAQHTSAAPAVQTPTHTPAPSKRKRASEVKDTGPVEKRRKSTLTEDLGTLPPERKKLTETLSTEVLAPLVNDLVKSGRIRIPDGATETKYCDGVALDIDDSLATQLGPYTGKGCPYFQQYSTLRFNFKKNPELLFQLLTRVITSEELANMSSDDMLNEERRKKDAALREAAEKQSVMIHEEGPRIRKTHKGDEYIGGEDAQQRARSPLPPPIHREESEAEGTDGAVGSTPAADTKAPLTIDTAASPKSPKTGRQPSAGFNIQSVWSSVQTPDADATHRRSSQPNRRQSSMSQAPQQSAGEDKDIDRMLQDDNEDQAPDFSSDPDIIWHGNVTMPPLHKYHACARHVAGGDIGQKVPWKSLIPSNPEIRGRIDPKRANEYIISLRGSATTDLSVLNLTPVDETAFHQKNAICNYFLDRDRWGVIHDTPTGPGRNSAVRDIYIVPVKNDATSLPPFLDMLEHCTVPAPPNENLLLMCIIARTASPPPDAEATPGLPAPIGTPATPAQPPTPINQVLANAGTSVAPAFSPVVPQGHFGTPPQQLLSTPLAAHILGPLLGTHCAQEFLKTAAEAKEELSEHQLLNLKSIMEEHPETRTDLTKVSQFLAARMMAAQSAQVEGQSAGDMPAGGPPGIS